MLQQFLKDLKAGIAPKACGDPNNIIWRQIAAYEKGSGKPMTEGYTRQEYLALFNSMNIRSNSYYNNRRSAVVAYVKYLVKKGCLPPEHVELVIGISFSELTRYENKEEKILYYHNVTELEDAIQNSLDASECYDKTRYDLAICALYLAWFGFAKKEIIELQKTDVQKSGILRSGQLVPLPVFVCEALQRYCYAEGYEQQARGIIFHEYKPSTYLFRSTRMACITDEGQLNSAINRLNSLLNGKYSLKYDIVRKSGILYRVYQKDRVGELRPLAELENDIQLASTVFEGAVKTKTQVSDWIKDYVLYKRAVEK